MTAGTKRLKWGRDNKIVGEALTLQECCGLDARHLHRAMLQMGQVSTTRRDLPIELTRWKLDSRQTSTWQMPNSVATRGVSAVKPRDASRQELP